MNTNKKVKGIVMSAVIIASIFAFSAPAAAVYNFDGYELKNMVNGTIQGDVYVGGGHGTPTLIYPGAINPENPYNQTFEVPAAAGTVKWARLYVGIWAGNAVGGGWLNVTYTNNTGIATTLKNITCGNPDGESDNTPAYDSTNSSYNTGCGCWLVAINCTNNATSGTNTVNASTATSPWDGRVYGVVLVVVYENSSSPKVQYWVNEGNVNLHYPVSIGGSYHPELNNNVTWFNGTAYNSTEANLTVLYYTGDLGENDYLFMNVKNVSDSPGNLSDANVQWNNGLAYWRYQIDDKDVANERTDNCSINYSSTHCDCSGAGCGGCCCDCEQQYYSTYGFDINCFSETNDSNYMLKDIINTSAANSNYAIFWRGRDDDGSGSIAGTFEDPADEGEAYMHPILAVLRLQLEHVYDFSTGAGTDKWAYEGQVSSKPPGTINDPTGAIDSYSNIEADDGTYETYETTSNGNYAAQRFNFSIDESASEISKINVTWNGKGLLGAGGGTNDGATLYIWNGTGYELLENSGDTGDEEVTLTGERTSSISNYINAGNVTVLVEQNSAHSRQKSKIETDYVKLVITLL